MKKIAATLSLALASFFSSAHAVNYYWDATNGLGNGVGGTGSFTTNSTTWSTTTSGDATLIALPITGDAIFQGTPGTVSISSSSPAMNSITVNISGYTLQNTSTGSNRYLYSTNQTAGIIIADGVTLNLSSAVATYNNGALGIVGNVTNAAGATGFSTIAITGNSGTTAGSGIRVITRTSTNGSSGFAGTNKWITDCP